MLWGGPGVQGGNLGYAGGFIFLQLHQNAARLLYDENGCATSIVASPRRVYIARARVCARICACVRVAGWKFNTVGWHFISKFDTNKTDYNRTKWKANVCLLNVKTLNTMVSMISNKEISLSIEKQICWPI